MSVANEEVGEHELELDGTTYVLRPSYAAMQAIEKQTGRSLISLTRAGNLGELTLEQVGIIAAETMRAGADTPSGRGVQASRVGQLCYSAGLPDVISKLTVVLVDAVTGGCDPTGKRKAVATKTGDLATAD